MDLSVLGDVQENSVYTLNVAGDSFSIKVGSSSTTLEQLAEAFVAVAFVGDTENVLTADDAMLVLDTTRQGSVSRANAFVQRHDIDENGLATLELTSGERVKVSTHPSATEIAPGYKKVDVSQTVNLDLSGLAVKAGSVYTFSIDYADDSQDDETFSVKVKPNETELTREALLQRIADVAYVTDENNTLTSSEDGLKLVRTDGFDLASASITVVRQATDSAGSLSINLEKLEAERFELRALDSIEILTQSAFTLNGFVGGVSGFDAAKNIKLAIGTAINDPNDEFVVDPLNGQLTLRGGIVAATENLSIRAGGISSDGASVFLATDLNIQAHGAVEANTLTDTITVEATAAGAVAINEADGLIVHQIRATDGRVDLTTGGDTTIHQLSNVANGDAINVSVIGNLAIDRIESATSAGAQKASGAKITIDALGDITEYHDALPAAQEAEQEDRLRGVDVFGHTLVFNTAGSKQSALSARLKTIASPNHADNTSDGTGLEILSLVDNGGASVGNTAISITAQRAGGGVIVPGATAVTTPAGQDAAQVAVIDFVDEFAEGHQFKITIDGTHVFTTTVQATGGVVESVESMLTRLKTAIETADVFDVAVNGAEGTITLTHKTVNTAFSAAGAITTFAEETLTGAATNAGTTPTQSAGFNQAQITDLTLDPAYGFASGTLVTVIDGVRLALMSRAIKC